MNAKRRWHFWLRGAVVIAMAYLAVALFAGFVADALLFHPELGSRRGTAGGFHVRMRDGTELSGCFLPNPAARFTLWYFHGNAEDLGDLSDRLAEFRERGFAVFAVEYPGYGRSGGTSSEASLFAASRRAAAYLKDELRVPSQNVVVYGRSLGGGPAVDIATREPVAGLILESAFMSAYRVMTDWRLLPGDKFENLRRLPDVRCPILVIHGRQDRVVPFRHGEALLAAARHGRSLWVERAGHNDVEACAGESYWAAIGQFTASLDGRPDPRECVRTETD